MASFTSVSTAPMPGGVQLLLPPRPRLAYRHVSTARSIPAARILDRPASEALFLEHLPRIEKTIGILARRHGVRDDDAADLGSWIKLRLVEDDYAIIRKFRGESAITTYLTVVIATLLQDYKVQRWGRWRPSAAAQRMGKVALKLEALIYRHRYEFAQATQLLRSSGDTDLSDRELASLLAEIPRRSPQRPREVGEERLVTEAAQSAADDLVEQEADINERAAVETALRLAMDSMHPEDQCMLTMRFWQDMSVAEIARALKLPQKPLYRRLDRALGDLRRELIKQGISSERAQTIVGQMEP